VVVASNDRHRACCNDRSQQVAYTVEDVEAVAETLRDRGLRVLYDRARRGTAGSLVNFVHPKDAGGVLVELVQPASGPAPSPH